MNYSEALESKYSAIRSSEIARSEGFESTDHLRRFGVYERRSLRMADAYFWSHSIAQAVLTSSVTLPYDTKLSLAEYQTGHAGWFWFERPIHCPPIEPFSGVLWTVSNLNDIEHPAAPMASEAGFARCLFVTTYRIGRRSMPEAVGTFFIEDPIWLDRLVQSADHFDQPSILAARARESGGRIMALREGLGVYAFLIAALLWIDQTILVASNVVAERHTRRRLERAGIVDLSPLKVVRLRRAVHDGGPARDSDGEHVEWSCQWIVRGHWRQQFYPSTGERRPLFILPHVKGPEDKPLKVPAPTVFVVNR